jgi:hypothetical protein
LLAASQLERALFADRASGLSFTRGSEAEEVVLDLPF